ncbi:hypothetical protein FJ872_28760 [Mesorhizobium sp. B2-5-9]|uniref:hypothetical protein n=1 Tax=Mesorhizobium sp. B2-5-9 TaxID=2589921 RepID=UPI001129B996|nr:hypothetical protein [Mesorhizobium sp. B2-5-9]TPK02881.1 hypothetical protein FJ872_28760 [Mesorhizobium sp. B2-5-9]
MKKKKKPKLQQPDKLAIRGLKRADVELTTAGLKRFLERSKWIGTTNYYAKDVVGRLENGVPGTPGRKRHLAQYIAASVALHANDGWSYLSRAVACILAGDTHRSLHMAYYAELRAAMSLLASAGIGVFDKQHYIISGTNLAVKLRAPNGTHIMAWLALEEWSRRPASGTLFSTLIRPEGRTLNEWFQLQGGASSLAPQAKAWFMQWGMDLGVASKDREARNESSYRPDGVPTTWEVSAKGSLDFVRDMWSTLEPSSASSFEQIDRHILRRAVERHYFSVTGRTPSANDGAYVALINTIVEVQSFATATEQRLKSFLLRQSARNDPQIFQFSAMKPGNPQSDAFAIMSRAVLLLRLATGAAHLLLNRAGLNANLLGFWWERLGETRGLWRPGSPPSALTDLWADVEESLRDISNVETSTPEVMESFRSLSAELPGSLNMLATHERVSLWGLCPA